MSQIIYMEVTMPLLVDSMHFKTHAEMDAFVENGFTENETKDGVIYYTKKDQMGE